MGTKSFTLSYDKENDILNMAFGKARRAVSVEGEDEVFLRVNPDSQELVGLTILGFRQSFLDKRQKFEVDPKLIQSAKI